MTRIMDDPAAFADESLDGFVAANRNHVMRVDGGVVRGTESPKGNVALVIGGGSGHYPAFSGLVGPGLAAGAACGNMFASPAAAQIYRVAKAAQTGGGVLLSYGNYAGDVLHFGQAQQRLNDEGIYTKTVVVTDDIASAPLEEIMKRRGIAGDLTVFKVAGAAAEAGLSLDEVERVALKANDRTRSLGVAFDGCTLPGAAAPLFAVPESMMSLGLGIHGEPGISDLPMPTASELAALLVSRLLTETPAGAGKRVSVIVNGLGTVKYDELFLLFGKIEALLLEAGLEIIAPQCGELVTSLDMAGLSLTLFWLDEELESYWLAPADTPAFRQGSSIARPRRSLDAVEQAIDATNTPASEAAVSLGAVAAQALGVIRQVIVANEADLGDLDAIAGDGDHGIGMRRGVDAAHDAAVEAARDGAGVREVLIRAGEQWSERAGGTSGALWGAALIAVANTLGDRERFGPLAAAEAATAFSSSLITLGKASRGDKTMVDAVLPFTEVLTTSLAHDANPVAALRLAANAAVEAADATRTLRPLRGRARPLAERSIGHPDPGAVSFGLIVSGLAEHFATPKQDNESLDETARATA